MSFWQITLRAIPIIAALVSTSLLAYFVLIAQRSEPSAQLQQGLPENVVQAEPQRVPQEEPEQQEQPPQQTAQADQPQQQPQQPPIPTDLGPRLPMPGDDKLVILMMSSILALNQANATGNYTVLRDGSAPSFQRINSPERLAQIFSGLRARNLDLSPIVLYQPKLFRRPEMNGQGMIRITGFFPTQPERVNFDLAYQPVQGQWRLFGIAVETGNLQPPPGAPQQQQSAPSTNQPQEKSSEATDTEKPPVPARQTKAKPKATEAPDGEAQGSDTSKPSVDVRDRIDHAAPTPAPEKPKPKGVWNPFGR